MQLPVCAYFILLALSAASFVVHQSDDLNDDIGGFRNYTGKFRAFGIPTRLSCDDQKVKVDGHCLEEATKRNIDIDPVAPRTRDYDILEHSPICKSMDFPLHQVCKDTRLLPTRKRCRGLREENHHREVFFATRVCKSTLGGTSRPKLLIIARTQILKTIAQRFSQIRIAIGSRFDPKY